MSISAPSSRQSKATIMLVFLAIVSAMSIILPVVIGILLANMYSEELLEQDLMFQFTLLGSALLILVVVNVYTLMHTVGFKGKRR